MHAPLVQLWQLGKIPHARAIVSGIFLLLAVSALMSGDGGPLGRRIAAEMVATFAGGYNATLAPPAYGLTSAYLWANS